MIMLIEQKIVILTPPKTASSSLHYALSLPPFSGLTVVGDSMYPGNVDKHTVRMPNESSGYKVLACVRHPLDRLVSLYCHYTRDESSYHGRWSMAFWDFCNRVCRNIPIIEKPVDIMYHWTQAKHLEGVKLDGLLRNESLSEDLLSHGLADVRLERLNTSYRRPWQDYFDDSLLVLARKWAEEDSRRFGYDIGTSAEVVE